MPSWTGSGVARAAIEEMLWVGVGVDPVPLRFLAEARRAVFSGWLRKVFTSCTFRPAAWRAAIVVSSCLVLGVGVGAGDGDGHRWSWAGERLCLWPAASVVSCVEWKLSWELWETRYWRRSAMIGLLAGGEEVV